MAILLELENDGEESSDDLKSRWIRETLAMRDRYAAPGSPSSRTLPSTTEPEKQLEPDPNRGGFSAALSCYPIVSALSPHLDLNSLASLARTCRQFRANLLPFRAQLIAQSLRCVQDEAEDRDSLADRLHDNADAHGHGFWGARRKWDDEGPNLTSGRVGRCARDLVAECRKCGNAVCRNCIVKPPPPRALPWRHRRLCPACLARPISYHTDAQTGPPFRKRSDSYGNNSTPELIHGNPLIPEPQPSSDSIPTLASIAPQPSRAFTAPAFAYDPCNCADQGVWVCQPCTKGAALTQADTTYFRGWAWRTRYAARLSGNGNGSLGNGVGEGVEGVECGRRGGCAAAKHVEVEEEVRAPLHSMSHLFYTVGGSYPGSPPRHPGVGHEDVFNDDDEDAGYHTHEIQGVGGTVMRKVKRRVLVGAAVGDLEEDMVGWGDEAGDRSQPLWEEREGRTRSWCAWCSRVIPSRGDLEKLASEPVHEKNDIIAQSELSQQTEH